MTGFTPFDEFDQDDKFPHLTSRTILEDMQDNFRGVMALVAGIGVVIDSTDPSNPIITVPPVDYGYLKVRTEVPLTITGNTPSLIGWAYRDVRATAAALVKIPVDAPIGFTFNLQRGTAAVVGLELDGADVFEPSFGSGVGVTQINITDQNGWVSVMKMAAGIIAVVGQCEDGTPP